MVVDTQAVLRRSWGQALAATSDEAASAHLSRLGLCAGWRCLVVGPGTARLARWTAGAVAPDGYVVTDDATPTTGHGTVEVVARRIGRDPLPARAFDLVVARLSIRDVEPDAVVEALASSVRSGGWLFVQACDWITLGVGSVSPALERARAACAEVLRARGERLDLGRGLGLLLRGAGLEDVDAVGRLSTLRGTSGFAELAGLTLELLRADLISSGRIEPHELDRAVTDLHDPSNDSLSHALFSAWGRAKANDDGPEGPGRGQS